MKRMALLLAMTVVALNVWTGGPLMALWIGSRLQSGTQPTMAAVFAVIVLMGLFAFLLLKLLRVLGGRYDEMTGHVPAIRQHTPWLRSMRGARPLEQPEGVRPNAAEVIVIAMVVVVVMAFEVWFFFFSASPIDQRSGRDSASLTTLRA